MLFYKLYGNILVQDLIHILRSIIRHVTSRGHMYQYEDLFLQHVWNLFDIIFNKTLDIFIIKQPT